MTRRRSSSLMEVPVALVDHKTHAGSLGIDESGCVALGGTLLDRRRRSVDSQGSQPKRTRNDLDVVAEYGEDMHDHSDDSFIQPVKLRICRYELDD